MMWHYNCPQCGTATAVTWDWLEKELICPHCGANHYPPTPHEDHYAYVDTPSWPPEIEEAVTALRGTVCAVPSCYRARTTLAHRKPLVRGGVTSVDNLIPMCARHAESKGDRNYDEWLCEIRRQEAEAPPSQPQIEITITSHRQEEQAPSCGYQVASGLYVPVAAGRPERPGPKSGAVAPWLFCRMPFLRGTLNRLLLDYDWEMVRSGLCRVYVLAWPKDQEPDLKLLGSPQYAWLFSVKEHLGVAGEKGTHQLELALPDAPGGRWTAAAALIDEGCDFELAEYALAGTV